MTGRLKKTPLYIIFLNIRTRYLNDHKLLSQLLKRAHWLDKTHQKNRFLPYVAKEVELCLNEVKKRKIPHNNAISWAAEVLARSSSNKCTSRNTFFSAPVMPQSHIQNDLERIIKSRRSIRNWTDDSVEIKDILHALDCAQWAPSSCNRQPLFFLILSKKDHFGILKTLSNQSFFMDADKIIVVFVNMRLYNRRERSYAFLDSGAAIQNLLLALHALQIGACQLGVKQTSKNQAKFRSFLNTFDLPEFLTPVSFVALGKTLYSAKAPGRKKVDQIVKVVSH